jgi:hypothetical protein
MGFGVAMLAYGLMCTGLLVLVLWAVDDLKADLRRETALRVAAEELLSHEQLAVRDIAVATATPVRDVAASLERAMLAPVKGLRP